MTWKAGGLWDFLKDKVIGEYHWHKEDRGFAKCFVCYYQDNKEIGFIPMNYGNDIEWKNWWDAAYERHPDGLTLNILMSEIMDRYQNYIRRKSY